MKGGYWQDSEWKELTMIAYCMKCRESRAMQEAEQVTMKNDRPATRGKCGECGTGMYRIGKAS